MKIEDCFYLGKILKPFSYKGEVVLFLDVDEPMDYSELDGVYVSINKKLVLYTIKSIRINNNKATVRFDGVEYECVAEKNNFNHTILGDEKYDIFPFLIRAYNDTDNELEMLNEIK